MFVFRNYNIETNISAIAAFNTIGGLSWLTTRIIVARSV